MEQANGEKHPAYSITTATDTTADIITHFQLNPHHDDGQALWGSIEGSRLTVSKPHRVIVVDAAFLRSRFWRRCQAENQLALIPDQRIKVECRGEPSRGEYDRSKFGYRNKSDCYPCP